jgi:hypothetical protein
MDDKDNATKANQHFGHAHGHGFHGMHISPMREAMEKPSTYINIYPYLLLKSSAAKNA